jgi:hypothetical protein
MEVWSTNPKTISGAAQVRETFTVSGPSRTFTQVKVRLQRLAGSSPLTVRLTEADGTLITQGTVPAAGVRTGVSAWATCTFPLPQALATGVSYNLTLGSPADTQYAAYPIRKGLDKGFSRNTCFADGCAQFTTTGSTGWDLQFLFVP